jgi:hypothetical protein
MFEKEVKITCDYNDIEKIILEEYGHQYEIMPMEEVGSSQYAAVYEVNVSQGELVLYQREYLDNLKQGRPDPFCLVDIMQDLCNKGKLEAGSYIIDVSW